MKIAYLGPPGTYSQAAALNHFGEQCEFLECPTIDDVFIAVETKQATYGVVPVENSTEGAVNNTQDCLVDSPVTIVGEEVVAIRHNLLLAKGSDQAAIARIASHKQSLAQCRNWLLGNYPGVELVECASNSAAAKLALKEENTAAIAGELAASLYDLEIRNAGIQDHEHNSTRFLILANDSVKATGQDKTSVLIYTENKPGALFRVLEPFEELQISLTKIETRPSKKEAWEYVFFIDFEGHIADSIVVELFDRLKSCTAEIKVLGSYPCFKK